jgi:NADH:ubiquinone oxidoreductase subunit 3 (subunit A)
VGAPFPIGHSWHNSRRIADISGLVKSLTYTPRCLDRYRLGGRTRADLPPRVHPGGELPPGLLHTQEQKYITYESGVDPLGGWGQAHVRYYLYALLFVMFDVEAVFIFPWAVRLESLSTYGLIEMIVFIFILALGLLYAWRKGVLRWA